MTPPPAGRLHRRRLLSAAAVTVAAVPLAACEDVPLESSAEGATSADGTAVDPDEALLDDAVRLEAEMLGSLQALLGTAPPRLRSRLRRTIDVHRAHLDLLTEEGEPPSSPTTALRAGEVAAREEGLARRHADAAVRASSGQFARVLAGMAAGAAQQAETWRSGGPT